MQGGVRWPPLTKYLCVQLFFDILSRITLPLLALVVMGYGAQRRLQFDVTTLTGVQLYVIAPAALVYFPYATKLPLGAAWPVLWFSAAHFAFLFALGWGIAAALGMSREIRGLTALVAVYSNSGYYGIPLINLAFPADYLLFQTVVTSLHSILIAPLAFLAFASRGEGNFWKAMITAPLLPAVALGFLLKGLGITLPDVLLVPLKLLANSFTPMALLLLGVQLASIDGKVGRAPLALGVTLRMIVAPATAWLFAALLGFPPGQIAFFVVSAAAPAAVFITIFAIEYKAEPGLASMIVFLSTVVSALTVTAWIFAVRYTGLQ